MPKLFEYRCTRPDLYKPGSIGHADRRARQGHYIVAKNEIDARFKMKARYLDDLHIDVDLVGEADPLAEESP